MSEHCRVCSEPMSDRYCAEQAHWWHEKGCKNSRVLGLEWVGDCDCSGFVHVHCCPCKPDIFDATYEAVRTEEETT